MEKQGRVDGLLVIPAEETLEWDLEDNEITKIKLIRKEVEVIKKEGGWKLNTLMIDDFGL